MELNAEQRPRGVYYVRVCMCIVNRYVYMFGWRRCSAWPDFEETPKCRQYDDVGDTDF